MGGAVGRRSVWSEIARDRELRRRQNDRAGRVQRKIERELEVDASQARDMSEKQAKAQGRERIDAAHRAALVAADE